jgi:hypothetical protein
VFESAALTLTVLNPATEEPIAELEQAEVKSVFIPTEG